MPLIASTVLYGTIEGTDTHFSLLADGKRLNAQLATRFTGQAASAEQKAFRKDKPGASHETQKDLSRPARSPEQ